MALDRKRLESITINGLDVVLLMMHMTIEIVAAISPTSKDTDQRLTDIANHIDGAARKIVEPRMHFLMTQFAIGLIATE
jgi:hypothetical protein